MKVKKYLCVTIVALAFTIAAGAQAKAKDSGKVILYSDATVAGSHLARGSYDVEWQTHSPEATIKFLLDYKVMATAEGKVVNRGIAYPSNEVVYNQNAAGVLVIQEIRFKGSSDVVEFNQ